MLKAKKLDNGETEITLSMPGFDTYSFSSRESIAYTIRYLVMTDLVGDIYSRVSSAVALADDVLKEGFYVWISDDTCNGNVYMAGDEDAVRARLDTYPPKYTDLLLRKGDDSEYVLFGTERRKDIDGNDVTYMVFRYYDSKSKTDLCAWKALDYDDLETQLISSFFECLLNRLWSEKGEDNNARS